MMIDGSKRNLHKVTFVGMFLFTALPLISSPIALVTGFLFSILFGNPFPELTSKIAKSLLKLSVVGLGFGVNFVEVIEVGKSSLLVTFVGISLTLGFGYILGRLLKVPASTRTLISFGTAICGGSAIAAMAPVVKARDEEIAVSLATVFTLNAVALVLFPPLGYLFEMDPHQFGLWSALAIHDTSSVVGASAVFGAVALTVGTTAKLTRALWIAPCTLAASLILKSGQRVGVPLFIIGFIAAAFVNSWLPDYRLVWDALYGLSKQTLVMTLFLIGAGLTRPVLKQVGLRPLAMGTILWFFVSIATLLLILAGHIR